MAAKGVFVSYARRNPRAKETIEAIRAELEKLGWTKFVDEDLDVGDPWRRKLLFHLRTTHAGIVLLSREALDSPWVATEVGIMSYRTAAEDNYKFIPVLIDITKEDIDADRWFAPAAVTEIQIASGEPEVIAAKIGKALGKVGDNKCAQTLLERVARQIEIELDALTDTRIGALLAARGIASPAGEPVKTTLATWVATQCIESGESGLADAVVAVAKSLGATTTKTLIDLLAPLWIPFEHTGSLRSHFKQSRIPAVNGRRVAAFTAQALVDRASWPNLLEPRVLSLTGGSDGTSADLIAQILATARSRFALESDDDARALLEQQAGKLAILLPQPLPDAALQSDLRKAFPKMLFLADAGEPPPSTVPPCVEALPPIDIDAENRAYLDVVFARQHAKDL